MPEPLGSGRHAGVLVPLFSIPSRASWGIGEIPDLPRFARWLRSAGLDIVQILPVNEMADGQNSPYSALSAMATDPIYIAVGEIEEFRAGGGEASLSGEERAALAAVRGGTRVDYGRTRALKSRALRAAFDCFEGHEWRTRSARAESFRGFMRREAWWLEGYAVFRALHRANDSRYWIEWQPGERERSPEAIESARARMGREILYDSWLQWIADEQWLRARAESAPVRILGDFPFMVSGDSADVWWRQDEFRIDASVGVPPDAFSETGQDWGLPAYRWDVIRERGYEWLHQRARRSVELYDGFRLDHLVGFYRTFMREGDGRAHFEPADEPSQLTQGERVLGVVRETGAFIIAEDLGTVPDFVRASLARLAVPGMKVMRWEREWDAEGRPFRAPASYPAVSVATSGTHDTETLAEWWEAADRDERQKIAELAPLRDAGLTADEPYSDRLRDALLDALFGAGSNILLLPLQDIFGWRDRINIPAVVDRINWTWRLPWAVDDLASEPQASERARFLRELGERHGRGET
ncbi:MAG: 4-alpha-glucanotransferase [Acidobacteria bacterium RIFCSPLOWO2_02_FULL_67_36]|nr:MAG: 4-alpha-glucanotransferase [Acidobacteria bacterium RIFCSPLOWO2_02_FULL_67_36]OFW25212.1 MAG: 4-alpha-glucanotransferase [Acidobacteria bacterium RIFCSPLOWO2_12_FULL_66_21]